MLAFSSAFPLCPLPPLPTPPSAGCACKGEPATFQAELVEVTLLCDLHVLWTVWVEGIFAILYYSFDCLRETFKITQFTCVFSPSQVSEIRLLDYNLNVHELEPENLVFSVYIFHTPPPPPPCMERERERQSAIIVMTVSLLTFWQNRQEYCCLCMPSFVEFLVSAIAEYPSHSHDNNFNREEHPDQHCMPYTCPPLVSLSCSF